MKSRRVLTVASLTLFVVLLTGISDRAMCQKYPTKPITIFVPAPAGGGTDVLARIIGDKFTESWGQQIVVDNRGGASGMIAAELAARAKPDGYTLFFVYSGVLTQNKSLYRKLPYDPEKDFDAVAIFVSVPNILVVHPSLPVKSVPELIAYAKANPGKLNWASSGVGVSNHLAMEMFRSMAGIDVVHVPYKGGAPAMIDLLGGHVQVMFNNLVEVESHVKAGKLRALAVATTQRIDAMPELPVIADFLPGYENTLWYGMVAPAGTPKEIISQLNAEILRIQKMPDVKKRLAETGSIPVPVTPAQMAAVIEKELAATAKTVKDAGIQPKDN